MNKTVITILEHRKKVQSYLQEFVQELTKRGIEHDESKFSQEEFTIYVRVIPKLQQTTYGTAEYYQVVKELGPALTHHYQQNDHHPEHFSGGIDDMNLFQLIEMICDWMPAIEKIQTQEEILKNLEINKKRFNISEQLFQIIKNTIINNNI